MSEKPSVASYPSLLAEWDWQKNMALGLQPESITIGSVRKIHWKCSLGHCWEATPNNRSRGQGCPVCAGRKIEVGFNDLATKHPEIASEWNLSRNEGLLPTQVTAGSNRRVWWICHKCGHEWQTSVNNRAAGKGCPICSRAKQGLTREQNIVEKNGSFASCYPELLNEWDYRKNTVDPQKITKDSTRRVWWNCLVCGYSWATTVGHRTKRRSGCPACANKVATARNSVSVTHPHVLKIWNYKRNLAVLPEMVTAGSNKKVWWICEKGHEWQATVNGIVNGSLCPVCCGQRVQAGYNDLATVNPLIAREWHPVKNGDLLPSHFNAGSTKERIWWLCSKGHEYQSTIANRTRGGGCPFCEKERKTSFPEQAIFYYLGRITCAKNRYLFNGKTEIDVYLPEYQIGIEYDGYYYHRSNDARLKEQKKDALLFGAGIFVIRIKEVHDISAYQDSDSIIYCHNGGNYQYLKEVIRKILQRIQNIKHINMMLDVDVDLERDAASIMSQYILSEKENSLANKYPELAMEWHPTRNGFVLPEMVSCASGKKVWWLGKCGHEWSAVVGNRIIGNGCPICSNKKVLVGFNDLETTHPELSQEWDYTKNGSLSPQSITFGSDKKVWWICSEGHSYQATVSNRCHGKNCPYCSNNKVLQGYNDLASQHPEIAAEWDYGKNQKGPNCVLSGSNKKVWWRCKTCGHEWLANPNHRVYRQSGCPACSGRVATPEENLMIVNPQLCREWNETRNSKSPSDYRPQSNQKVWWICSTCGYEWQAKINDRSNGTGCPCCAGKVVAEGVNDLATLRPDLINEWDYEKNVGILPNEMTLGSHKKVWWRCSACNNEWEASVANRSRGRGCPLCARSATVSSRKKSIFQYSPYGEFLKEYRSIKEAKEVTGINFITPCSEKTRLSGGFIWLLERNDDRATEIASVIDQVRIGHRRLPVLQYTLSGILVKKYASAGEAERENNISRSKVGECCRGKRKTAGGYVWKYDMT